MALPVELLWLPVNRLLQQFKVLNIFNYELCLFNPFIYFSWSDDIRYDASCIACVSILKTKLRTSSVNISEPARDKLLKLCVLTVQKISNKSVQSPMILADRLTCNSPLKIVKLSEINIHQLSKSTDKIYTDMSCKLLSIQWNHL